MGVRPIMRASVISVIALCLLIVFGVGGLWLAAYIWKGRQPLPGYGRSAYLGRPAGASLDVDLYGDPRYGGTTPEVITLDDLRGRNSYPIPQMESLGPPDRVDYWACLGGLARLVWLGENAELWLMFEPMTAIILERLEEPIPANVPGISEFTIRGVRCRFYDIGGARPQLAILSPDKSWIVSFMQSGMTPSYAKSLAAECVESLWGPAQPSDN